MSPAAPSTELPRSIIHPLRRMFFIIFIGLLGFITWSIVAPLSTTIHTSGYLKSMSPSFDIQHPYGGKIAEVFVREHEKVMKGQPLLVFDTINETAQLTQLRVQINNLIQENTYLESRLQGKSPKAGGPQWLIERLFAMEEAARLKVIASRSNQAAITDQAVAMSAQVDATEARLKLMQDRYDDQQSLVQRGALTATEAVKLHENLLALTANLNSAKSQFIAMEEQIRQADMAASQVEHNLRTTLLDMFVANQKKLPDLRRRVLHLENQVSAALVIAPSDGMISVLDFDTDQMYAQKGETLLTLTKLTDEFQIAFEVPPQLIDQLSAGMIGQVSVTSLPQRNLPKLHAEITALSPEATRNQDGTIMSYQGDAKIQQEDLKYLLSALDGRARLSIDMPVSLSFSGREITFADYLVAPFVAFWDKSLQD